MGEEKGHLITLSTIFPLYAASPSLVSLLSPFPPTRPFPHIPSQELHVDLMRFPLPVVVKEVRIISLETKAYAELGKIGYAFLRS